MFSDVRSTTIFKGMDGWMDMGNDQREQGRNNVFGAKCLGEELDLIGRQSMSFGAKRLVFR